MSQLLKQIRNELLKQNNMLNTPLVTDYIEFNSNNFLDVLRGCYKGFNFNEDLLRINSTRKSIQKWDTLSYPNRVKAINSIKILCNVYDPHTILRFFLFNLDKQYFVLIITLFSLQHRLDSNIPNINNEDIVTSCYINNDILFVESQDV